VFINMNIFPFSLKEKERKYVLWHICANFNLPPKSTLGLILISLKMCKKSKKIVVSISLNSKTLVLNNINNYRNIILQILIIYRHCCMYEHCTLVATLLLFWWHTYNKFKVVATKTFGNQGSKCQNRGFGFSHPPRVRE
jgi:hypothetical protein